MSASPGILIIRLSSLGDILHALPAFADLRASFPNSKIDWLVSEKHRSLLSAVRGIDTIRILGTKAHGDFPLRSLIRDLRSQHYDFAIDFQGLLKTAALSFLSGARTRLGFSRDLAREFPAHWFYNRTQPKPQRQFHVLQLNRMLAGLTGAVPVSAPLEFCVPENDSRLVESMLQKGTVDGLCGDQSRRRLVHQEVELAEIWRSGKENSRRIGPSGGCNDGAGRRNVLSSHCGEHCGGVATPSFPRFVSATDPFIPKSSSYHRWGYGTISSGLRAGRAGRRNFRSHISGQKRTVAKRRRGCGTHAAVQLLLREILRHEE